MELPAYALQEPLRWIADVAVMEAFECGVLHLPDFYFTGVDYRYRFEIDAKRRFLDLLRERFNAGTNYNDRVLRWDTVIEQKAMELGRLLIGRSSKVDFSEPSPRLTGTDDRELRRRILGLSQLDGRRLGIGKSTLHYLRKKARERQRLGMYRLVRERLVLNQVSNNRQTRSKWP